MPLYRKTELQEMRPYTPGEDMEGVSIETGIEPVEGGMIATAANDPMDKWYLSPEFMEANYELAEKTLGNTDQSGCRDNVPDVEIFGEDLFKLLSKASSQSEGWMKSTKAMQVEGGCVVQVTTQQGDNIAEAIAFVPKVIIREQKRSGEVTGRILI